MLLLPTDPTSLTMENPFPEDYRPHGKEVPEWIKEAMKEDYAIRDIVLESKNKGEPQETMLWKLASYLYQNGRLWKETAQLLQNFHKK